MLYLNPKPKHGEDDTTEHSEVTEPEAKRRSVQDGKRDVKPGTNSSVECHNQRNDNITRCNARKGLTPLKYFSASKSHKYNKNNAPG